MEAIDPAKNVCKCRACNIDRVEEDLCDRDVRVSQDIKPTKQTPLEDAKDDDQSNEEKTASRRMGRKRMERRSKHGRQGRRRNVKKRNSPKQQIRRRAKKSH